jgi:hypothetical protein
MADPTVPTQALDGYTQEEDAADQAGSPWAELTSLVPSIPNYSLTGLWYCVLTPMELCVKRKCNARRDLQPHTIMGNEEESLVTGM